MRRFRVQIREFRGSLGNGFRGRSEGPRASVAAEIAKLSARISALEEVLSSFDGIIRFYDPSAAVAVPSPKAQVQRQPLPLQLQQINKAEAVFQTLREAGRPISTGECAETIGMRRGVDPADPALKRFSSNLSATLSSLRKRERVRQVSSADGTKKLWEIAA
ncbi:hypothetical protein SI859A1_02136 [Aurantimonas manganoxydans SI85-9A1]|uniref:Uncharacterized protein n=1 Tax=Aurantimonas manganoxydans (strain ATCC BAA-1229 / DSM 21871 / SI85-9A1) TaxID=287752 RepID=Q1YMR0_AURMS|nr:hypothetical protein [Aurantimonas manganoxydans]EAS51321.1 hypothetical protein SI859A1_02136 [Aurantimonas manganoxydans SI85-9A1]